MTNKTEHRFEFTRGQLLGMSMDDPGGCTACGAYVYGVEPDARRYTCDNCGKATVYGAQELLLMDLVTPTDIDDDD